MNERIKELRKQVKIDMHLHNLEDIKAMEGCFGQEGGNKIVNEYIEKFAELVIRECVFVAANKDDNSIDLKYGRAVAAGKILQHFEVK